MLKSSLASPPKPTRWGALTLVVALVCFAAAFGYGTDRAAEAGAGRQTSSDEHLDVTLTSDVPGTEFYLQNTKLGTADKDGKLRVKLPRGEYSITARRANYPPQPPRTIRVSAQLTTFPFFMGRPLPTPTPVTTPTPTPTPSAPDPPAAAASAVVMEHFLDPKTTDQVKLPDWESGLMSTYQELARGLNNPQRAQAHFVEGQIEYLKGDYDAARYAFNLSLRIVPDYALGHYGLGNVHLATKQPLLSVPSFRRAVELKPTLAVAHNRLGDAYMELKMEKEAAAAYARARELGYLPRDANLNTARRLVKSERWAEAQALLEPLAAKEPSAEVYILLGDCYDRQQQRIKAASAYAEAIKLDGNSALAHYKLAETQFEDRDYKAARDAYAQALKLDPDGQVIDVRRAREQIRKANKKLQG